MEEFLCDVWYTVNVSTASNRVTDCFTPLQIINGKKAPLELIILFFQSNNSNRS